MTSISERFTQTETVFNTLTSTVVDNKTYLQTVTYLATQTETATATETQTVVETALAQCLGRVRLINSSR